jgi:hypothetical protein
VYALALGQEGLNDHACPERSERDPRRRDLLLAPLAEKPDLTGLVTERHVFDLFAKNVMILKRQSASFCKNGVVLIFFILRSE